MNETINALNELSASWGAQLWKASWQGGVVLLLVFALTRVLRRIPPELQCWLWRLALCKLLLAVVLLTPVELPWLPPEAVQTARISHVAVVGPAAEAVVGYEEQDTAAVDTSPSHLSHRTDLPAPRWSTTLQVSGSTWLLAAWLAGATFFLVKLLGAWVNVHRIMSRLDRVDDERVRQLLAESCQQLHVKRIPGLRASNDCGSPYVVGVLRPLIVLPAVVLNSCPVEEQRAALAHELGHIKRNDLLWNWLPALCDVVFFFHPMIWIAKREWCLAQEIATDELAVSASEWDVAEYARSLVRLVEKCPRGTRHSQLAVTVSESYSLLSRRMIAMQTFQPIAPRRRLLVITAILSVALCGVIPWKLTAQEPDPAGGDPSPALESADTSGTFAPGQNLPVELIAGLQAVESAVQSLSVEYALESNNYYTKPGEPLPEKVQGLIEDDAVASFRRSQAAFFAMADGRFRNEVSSLRTHQRFDGSQRHKTLVVHTAFDGEKSRRLYIQITGDGSVIRHGSTSDRKSWSSPHPFDFTVHHLGVPISEILEAHGGSVIDQDTWEDAATTVVETNPLTRDNGYTSKRRYWIDEARNYLVVRRQILEPQNDGNQWVVHHQVDCKQHEEVQPGLWLPMRVEATNHSVPSEGPRHLVAEDILSISAWRVNEAPDENRFQLELPGDGAASASR